MRKSLIVFDPVPSGAVVMGTQTKGNIMDATETRYSRSEAINFAAAQHAFVMIDETPTLTDADRDAVARNIIEYGPAINH